jgi:hypothetical protein
MVQPAPQKDATVNGDQHSKYGATVISALKNVSSGIVSDIPSESMYGIYVTCIF